ncbi:putative G-patch domain, OCRE domain-containing protein [Dioscorea sansibarensis]
MEEEEEHEVQRRGGAMEGFTGERASVSDCSFVWDEDSKLYFHASSSGFYHDPSAGWYYSSRDGLYYTFENGAYVLLQSNKDKEEESDVHQSSNYISNEHEHVQDQQLGVMEHATADGTLNQCPPSEWLEETLIDLYLGGYSNSEDYGNTSSLPSNNEEKANSSSELEPDQVNIATSTDCKWNIALQQGDETVQKPEVIQDESELSDVIAGEENWLAQYGQVVQSEHEVLPSFPIVELWDWEMLQETTRKKQRVCRLTGRLVKPTSKLHPSMPVGGGLLKTAAICAVHLDFVRVGSGKVYRLRSPSTKYLASLSTYDSSNPTKDWGFPDLDIGKCKSPSSSINEAYGSDVSNVYTCDESSASIHPHSAALCGQKSSTFYRDRAAERRRLHAGFGIGVGEKSVKSSRRFSEAQSSSEFPDDAGAVAGESNTPFGEGSYARRILESMGWKEGEALGSSTKGIIEPVKAVGNRGFAGLGWTHTHQAN